MKLKEKDFEMEQQKACKYCKHMYEVQCARKRKVTGKVLNAYQGTYYNKYNINSFDLPFYGDERKTRGKIASFFFGKTCGETAQFFERK